VGRDERPTAQKYDRETVASATPSGSIEENMADIEVESLTQAQAARRQRVLDAAMALGAEGGYDAVQMRAVAERAEVALGTIYRYFSSKDHLLAATMIDWSADLEAELKERPPQGATTAARTVDVVRRATRNMEATPMLAAALVTAVSAHDPAASSCEREITATIKRVLAVPMADLDDQHRERAVRILAHVWNSALLRWVNGSDQPEEDVASVGADLEDAAHLLLDG
jgi:AcrR family transcriptional regulator